MVFGSCPDCGADIPVGLEPFQGQQVTCGNCDAILRVYSTNPLTIDWSDGDLIEFDEDEDEVDLIEDDEDAYEELWRRARRNKARQDL